MFKQFTATQKRRISGFMVILVLGFAVLLWLRPHALALYHQVRGGMILADILRTYPNYDSSDIACDLPSLGNSTGVALLKQAISHLEAARYYDSQLAQTYLLLGRAYCILGNIKGAIDAYNTYLALRPNNVQTHLELGFAYEANGLIKQATSEWQKSEVTSEEFLLVGQEKYHEKQYTTAIEWYHRSSQLGLLSDSAYFTGMVYHDQQLYSEALKNYQEALTYDNFKNVMISDVYYQQGVIYQWAQGYQNLEKALQMYDTAIQLGKFSSLDFTAESYYKRGEIYEWLGRDPQLSIIEYQKALAIRPKNFWARLRLGKDIYQTTKNVALAEREIKQAIADWSDPKYAKWPYRFLGDIYLDAGMPDKALTAYQEVLYLDPTDQEVLTIVMKLLANQLNP
jgi:tetratricopeptide (TPR) repeat protein